MIQIRPRVILMVPNICAMKLKLFIYFGQNLDSVRYLQKSQIFLNLPCILPTVIWIVQQCPKKISKLVFQAGIFNCTRSLVANGCLLDNQKYFFTFWYKIGKISTRKLLSILDDFLGFVNTFSKKMQEKVSKWGQKRTRRIST